MVLSENSLTSRSTQAWYTPEKQWFRIVLWVMASMTLLVAMKFDLPDSRTWTLHTNHGVSADVTNATLGFEQVVVVSAGPSWRLDGLHEAADLTGVNFTTPQQPAWTEAEIDVFRRRKPTPSGKKASTKGEYGIGPGQARCWLGHLNAIKRVIEKKWATALIMEDDADWDIKIKEQLQLVAPMVRELTNDTTKGPVSPYGDSWDLLWLGHSGDPIDFNDGRFKAAYDSTLPESTIYRHVYAGRSYFPPKLRVVHYSVAPFCTFAYAITQAAALKMYALSRGGQDEIITLVMHKWCSQGKLQCVTVNPELFHHHQRAGQVASQIATVEGWKAKSGPSGATYTANIQYSARCNSNATELVTCHSDWDDDEWR